MDACGDDRTTDFNLNEVIERTGLEIDEYLEIYELFQESFRELLDDVKAALAETDSEKIMHAAHTLKGATINMGFNSLSDWALKVQLEPENFALVETAIPRWNGSMIR